MSYKIVADLHTHTIASTHAYSTFSEMCQAAADKGLYALAITDHAVSMPGSPRDWYFNCLHELPLHHKGVLAIVGVEANVMDFEGTLDVSPEEFKRLNWGIASIHHLGLPGLENPTIEKCTHLWTQIAKKPYIHVVAHSGDPLYAYDYDRVIPIFGESHTLVEINSHSFESRKQNIPNCKAIALACKKHGVPLVVDSDAHFEAYVGKVNLAMEMLKEIDFPEELILNCSEQRLNDYLHRYTNTYEIRTDA